MINLDIFNRLMTSAIMIAILIWLATGSFWKHIHILAKVV